MARICVFAGVIAAGAMVVLGGPAAGQVVVAAAAPAPAVCEGVINAPPGEVWKVFSTAEGFKKLGPAKAEVDLRIGGLIRSHYDPAGVIGDEGTIQNQIIAYEPQRMLTIRIHQPPKGFPFPNAWKDAWTVLTFTDLGDGRTNLRIAMLGFGPDEESIKMREFFDKGNRWTLTRLQSEFDHAVKPAAAAHADGPLDTITVEAVIAASRDEVWRAFTTSAGWKGFAEVESRIGSVPGDPFEIYFSMEAPEGQRGAEGCTILSVVPGELFSFTWNAPPKFAHARVRRTWVVVDFQPVSAMATRVRLRHFGHAEQAAANADHREEWQQVRAYFAAAWPRVIGALGDHFAPAATRPPR